MKNSINNILECLEMAGILTSSRQKIAVSPYHMHVRNGY